MRVRGDATFQAWSPTCKRKLWRTSWSALLFFPLLVGCGPDSKVAQDAKGLEASEISKDAYIYAYPLMTMEMTRRASTNVAAPEGVSAPMGQFARLRSYPDASFKTVTAPNADTLYTVGWLDVSQGAGRPQHSRHEGTLFPLSHARRLDQRVSRSRQTYHRHRSAEIRHHRPGLERHASGGRERVQITDRHGMDSRPHLLHRDA